MSAIRGHHQLLMRAPIAIGYRALMLSYGPNRYFPMDDTTTTMHDLSAFSKNGAHSFVSYSQASPASDIGTAIGYNGSSSYSTISSSSDLNVGAGDWAFVFFCRWQGTNLGMIAGIFNTAFPFDGPTIFANYTGSTNIAGWICIRDRGNGITYSTSYTTPGLNTNIWSHFICQRRTVAGVTKLQIFLNGALVNEKTIPSAINHASHNLAHIGGRTDQQYLWGALDEMAIFKNRSFTEAEAATIFAASGM